MAAIVSELTAAKAGFLVRGDTVVWWLTSGRDPEDEVIYEHGAESEASV